MELPEPVVSGSGSPAEPVPTISPPAQYAHSAPRYIRYLIFHITSLLLSTMLFTVTRSLTRNIAEL